MATMLTSKGMQVLLLFDYLLVKVVLIFKSLDFLILGIVCITLIYTVHTLQYLPLKHRLQVHIQWYIGVISCPLLKKGSF